MDEIDKIKSAYSKRAEKSQLYERLGNFFYFNIYAEFEKELRISRILRNENLDIADLKLLEIGAGKGNSLLFFKRIGFKWENIYANELLDERFDILKKDFNNVNLLYGDFLKADITAKFDVIYQSLVFSSVLNTAMRQEMAEKMWHLVVPEGLIIWYDFKFDNPNNKDVRGVRKNEVLKYFPHAKNIRFYDVTLLPPIGRRVGKYYNLVNFLLPFLRSHYIAVIKK